MRSITEFLGVLGQTAFHFSRAEAELDIYEHALDGAAAITGATRSSMLLFDADGTLRFKRSHGLSDEYRAAVEGHAPWTRGQTEPKPLLVLDVTTSVDVAPHRDALLKEGIRSLAFFPLVTGSGTIGKLAVYWGDEHRLPSAQIELLRALAGLTAFAVDRQRARDELEEERRLFIGGPSVVFKWKNRPTWPVEYASPNVETVFGYTPAALRALSSGYASIIYAEDLARVTEEVAAYTREGRPWFEQEYRLLRADGVWRWIYDFTVPVRAKDGEVTHYLGYLLDQTDRRAALEALSQRQRVESLGVMAGGVAHDFNNLLVGVMGNAGLALRLLAADSEAAAHVRDVQTAAHRASALTRQLLAYSGKAAFVLESIDVASLVRECVRLLGSVLSPRASLTIEVAQGTRIRADATQMRQLVINLLTNASDALEGGAGTIQVRAHAADVREAQSGFTPSDQALPPGKYVALEIEDTGVGMNEVTVKHIFDPFFTTKGQGRGLGLSAVLGIVRSHHGVVNVVSKPGGGSCFQLFLPATDAPLASARGESPGVPNAPIPRHVLVVDDEESVRSIVKRVLKLGGHEATTVANARDALALLHEAPDRFDLVLMDLAMPKMSGLEALAILRKTHPTLPVIIMSGYSKDGIQAPKNDAATRVLEKPFEIVQLTEIMDAALRSR